MKSVHSSVPVPTADALVGATDERGWPRPLQELAHALAFRAAGPARVTRSTRASPGALRLVCLPGVENPGLLLPVDHSPAAATAVRRSAEAGSWWTVRTAQVAALALSAGLLHTRPAGLLTLAFGNEAANEARLLTHLSEILGEEITVAVRIRPRRPNSKPVLLLLSLDGRLLGYAKVGCNTLTSALVSHEATVLAGFGDDERHRLGFDVPRVVHHEMWYDVQLLVVTVLPGGHGSHRDPYRNAMRQIASRSELDYTELGASDFWAHTQARLEHVSTADPSVAAVVAAARAISDRSGGQRLLFGSLHGDWTPWNMSYTRQRLSVWDWERSSDNAPVGMDAAHHLIMTANHRRRLDVRAIHRLGRRAEPIISDLGQASRHGPLLVFLALLEMAVRFEEARALGLVVSNGFAPLLDSALTFVSHPAPRVFGEGGTGMP